MFPKEEVLSEQQAAMGGLGGFKRKTNLNQISSSSFVLSETRVGDSSAAPNNSKNFTPSANKEEEGQTSVNIKQAPAKRVSPNILQSRSDRFSSKTKPSGITNSTTAVTKPLSKR